MTHSTPVSLLGIDGVLNAVTEQPGRAVWPVDQWIQGHASDGHIEWPDCRCPPGR